MTTLHEDGPHVHYRRGPEIPGKRAGKPVDVEGDIRQHARELLKQASLRREPGRSSFDIAVAVAETTMDDFMKNGAVLEAAFVRDVRDELLLIRDEVNHVRAEVSAEFDALDARRDELLAEFDELAETGDQTLYGWAAPEPPSSAAPADSTVQDFFTDFDTEPDEWASRRRHWRQTYAFLEPFERRVLLVGVGSCGVVAVSVVAAVMGALL